MASCVVNSPLIAPPSAQVPTYLNRALHLLCPTKRTVATFTLQCTSTTSSSARIGSRPWRMPSPATSMSLLPRPSRSIVT
jgi:hypothetical protein